VVELAAEWHGSPVEGRFQCVCVWGPNQGWRSGHVGVCVCVLAKHSILMGSGDEEEEYPMPHACSPDFNLPRSPAYSTWNSNCGSQWCPTWESTAANSCWSSRPCCASKARSFGNHCAACSWWRRSASRDSPIGACCRAADCCAFCQIFPWCPHACWNST